LRDGCQWIMDAPEKEVGIGGEVTTDLELNLKVGDFQIDHGKEKRNYNIGAITPPLPCNHQYSSEINLLL